MTQSMWRTEDGGRWFLVPDNWEGPPGDLPIRSAAGRTVRLHPAWVRQFEVSEEEGRRWAKAELGDTLDALKQGIDAKLAEFRAALDSARRTHVAEDSAVTPDAVSALFALLKGLPGLIGNSVSGDAARVARAEAAAADLERRLREAGIDLGERLSAFPARLERLRADLSARPRG